MLGGLQYFSMSKKFIAVSLFILAFIIGTDYSSAAQAKNADNSNTPVVSDIPEIDGTYDDREYPGVKVRVFVHREKSLKVTPPPPAIICSDDPPSTSIIGKGAWKLSSPWTYSLNPSTVPSSVGFSNLATIAKNGFDDWSSATGGKVVFSRSPDTTVTRQAYDGKNIIAWGRLSGSALGITYTRYYSSTGQTIDVDTILNSRYSWKWANSNICADNAAYDAEDILTHEQGHWLGLIDEYDAVKFSNATMYGYGVKGEVKKITLTTGDINGASAIYNP